MMVLALSDNLLSNDADGWKFGTFSVNFANAHRESEHFLELKIATLFLAFSDNLLINDTTELKFRPLFLNFAKRHKDLATQSPSKSNVCLRGL